MIKNAGKIPILRYGLIVLLITILFSGAFYLYLHYNSSKKLQSNISSLISARENSELIDSCLLNLYNADNNSRLYSLTGNKLYLKSFYTQINSLNDLLDKIKSENTKINTSGSDVLKYLINEKTAKTNNYIKLRLLTDSLINATLKIDSTLAYSNIKIPVNTTRTIKTTVHTDTLKNDTPGVKNLHKKNFFGKIIAAISHKKIQEASLAPPLTVVRDTQTKTTVQSRLIYKAIPKKARNYYRKLYAANTTMRSNEHAILLINSNLVISIVSELKKYKVLEMAYAKKSKTEFVGKMADVFNQYNYLAKLTLAALILLVFIVLYNIWKIFNNDRLLVEYTEKAKQYADKKSRFLANMSHEIRTPLNSVIGFSEQLGMSKLSPDQTEQINAIKSSSEMLLEVVNEILDFSKYETGKMHFEQQPFIPYNAFIDVLNNVTMQAAKKGLDLKKNILFDNDLCVSGDIFRLKQVIINLLTNAVKFTPSGQILLQASASFTAHDKVVLKVSVKDTGIGIKKLNLPMIFDEFAQVTDAQKVTRHKGTGLGLAICKKIVELQGGHIKVVSEPGKGSVFSFELPFDVVDKSLCIIDKQVNEAELADKVRDAYVLLVDDNPLNILLAKTILNKWHITYDVANNGQEAIELFEQNNYDLVLTDIQMPIMNGLELLALIRQNPDPAKANIGVIALTANVLKEHRDIYMQAGMDDIVLKPFVARSLIEKISLLLKNKYQDTGNILFRY